MRLKLRLNRPSGVTADIVVTADAAAPVGEIARTLARLDPGSVPAALTEPTLAVRFPGQSRSRPVDPNTPVGESSLASGADIELTGGSARGDLGPVRALLRVVEGPDRGTEFALRAGSRVIGRDESADLVLSDPLVSKRHVRVEVTRTVDLVDLNSANGIVIEGGQVTRVSLESGQTALLGDTLIRADIVAEPDAADANDDHRTGAIAFNRGPRVEPRYPGVELEPPEVPKERDPSPFPWLVLAAPLLMGVLLFFVLGRGVESLVFILLAPVMMIGTWLTQRMRNGSKRKRDIAAFDEKLERLAVDLAHEFEVERAVRLVEAPSTREVLDDAARLGPLLWTRRPEHWNFLNLRLGLGSAPTRSRIAGEGRDHDGIPEYAERLARLRSEYLTIEDVPIVDSLLDAGALGVAGDITPAARACNGLVAQLTGLHSPHELSVTAIVGPSWAREFEWLKWLPHTGAPNAPLQGAQLASTAATGSALLSALEELVEQRGTRVGPQEQDRGAMSERQSAMQRGSVVGEGGEPEQRAPTPSVLLLISDDAPVERARLVTLVERAVGAGVIPIWVAESTAQLPAACRAFLSIDPLNPALATVGLVRTGQILPGVRLEPLEPEQTSDFARRIASVSDAGALVADSSDVPRSVTFLSLVGPELAESSEAVIDRWRQNSSITDRSPGAVASRRKAGSLRAIVGQAAADAFHLDLRTHGPHALVGGTTGSGKSEFLQAWVLGMAAEHSPDRVTFLFVDYKGGSAFAECVRLPHCVGLVTDLSPHLVRRALTSLRAELHHREHLFNRKKVKDLVELEKSGDPEAPPALVLVIDEFAALANEVPEFVDGVVDIAQRGRSLGIHLIMATQRPAGVIKDNLRANTNLRIALRMADEGDSNDVVGDRVAAGFDPAIPGRAIAKTGPGRLTPFQSAYAGGWSSDEPEAPPIVVADLRFGAEFPWEEAPEPLGPSTQEQGPNDQARIVKTIVAAAAAASIPAPRRPWLDELAPIYDLTRLRQRTDVELILGVGDLPEVQRQDLAAFRPDSDGHLVVYGAGGSGKTTTLRTVAAAAGITPRGGPVDVYALDFGTGGLKMLEALPHVGAVVSGDDRERVVRLIKRLRLTADERSVRYSAASAGSIVDYRHSADAPDERRILLLLDNFAGFRTDFEGSPTYAAFQQLLAEGRSLGIHIAMSADRPGSVPTSIQAALQCRVVHRMADEGSYILLDIPGDVLGAASPPGRALVGAVETQIAIVGGDRSVSAQSTALEALGAAIARAGRAQTPGIGSLPTEVFLDELPAEIGGRPVLGVSDEDLAPIAFEPSGVMLLAGPPASGRSTAMAALVGSLDRALPDLTRYYIGNARSEIGSLAGWTETALSIEEAAELAKKLLPLVKDATHGRQIAILVEGIADFLSTAADGALVELVKAVRRSDQFLIAESDTSQWGSSWPLLGEVKSARTGFLLQPDGLEAEMILKTALPRVTRAEFPPGRGFLIARGRATRVQLPRVAH